MFSLCFSFHSTVIVIVCSFSVCSHFNVIHAVRCNFTRAFHWVFNHQTLCTFSLFHSAHFFLSLYLHLSRWNWMNVKRWYVFVWLGRMKNHFNYETAINFVLNELESFGLASCEFVEYYIVNTSWTLKLISL